MLLGCRAAANQAKGVLVNRSGETGSAVYM